MKILLLLTFVLSSCAFMAPQSDERKCYKDILSGEVFLLKEESDSEIILESREDRHMLWIEKSKNNDRYRPSSCAIRDQFKANH